jgi:hypothetical protein
VTVWDEIRFAFDPALQQSTDLAKVAVEYSENAASQIVEESYECDAGGSVTVTIRNRSADYETKYKLGRWAEQTKQVKPAQRRKKASNA